MRYYLSAALSPFLCTFDPIYNTRIIPPPLPSIDFVEHTDWKMERKWGSPRAGRTRSCWCGRRTPSPLSDSARDPSDCRCQAEWWWGWIDGCYSIDPEMEDWAGRLSVRLLSCRANRRDRMSNVKKVPICLQSDDGRECSLLHDTYNPCIPESALIIDSLGVSVVVVALLAGDWASGPEWTWWGAWNMTGWTKYQRTSPTRAILWLGNPRLYLRASSARVLFLAGFCNSTSY